mmetsp:Transcript_51861/g.147820  ORF Transcript_51861/g.147820 Transcript_51861/m.147820 type:complete len:244 (+) Transcript_51861:563-1294(+)
MRVPGAEEIVHREGRQFPDVIGQVGDWKGCRNQQDLGAGHGPVGCKQPAQPRPLRLAEELLGVCGANLRAEALVHAHVQHDKPDISEDVAAVGRLGGDGQVLAVVGHGLELVLADHLVGDARDEVVDVLGVAVRVPVAPVVLYLVVVRDKVIRHTGQHPGGVLAAPGAAVAVPEELRDCCAVALPLAGLPPEQQRLRAAVGAAVQDLLALFGRRFTAQTVAVVINIHVVAEVEHHVHGPGLRG